MKTKTHYTCRNCHGLTRELFSGVLLKYKIRYFDCSSCGYVQTEMPFWLDEAYKEAINDSDTGIMHRNQVNARHVLSTMLLLGKLNGTLVDCAGGYGILVRLLRDYGVNALWSDRYCNNLLAKGFEYSNEDAHLVTAFEAFEHFVNPVDELDRLLQISPNVLFSTEIIADPAPKQDKWWYYGKDHGQHVGFFRIKTLEKLAKDRGKYLLTNGTSLHLITDRPINSLLWNFLLRINKITPFIVRWKLSSKVWSDYMLMSRFNK